LSNRKISNARGFGIVIFKLAGYKEKFGFGIYPQPAYLAWFKEVGISYHSEILDIGFLSD